MPAYSLKKWSMRLADARAAAVAEAVHEVLRELLDALILELSLHDVLDDTVVDPVEELREVVQKDVPLRAVLPVVLLQVDFEPVHGEVVAFVDLGGTVVVDEGAVDHRHQGVVAETPLDNSFAHRDAPDVSGLPSFVDVELVEAIRPEGPIHQPVVGSVHQKRCLEYIPLSGSLPCDASPALAVGFVQIAIRKDHVEVVVVFGELGLLCQAFRPAPFVPYLSSFFTCH